MLWPNKAVRFNWSELSIFMFMFNHTLSSFSTKSSEPCTPSLCFCFFVFMLIEVVPVFFSRKGLVPVFFFDNKIKQFAPVGHTHIQ